MVAMILAALWFTAAAAGLLYAHQQNIPLSTALRILPAFLLELTFFYVLGSDRLRAKIERFPAAIIALSLTVAAVLPYSAAVLALGSFGNFSFLALAGLAAVIAFWYVILPHKSPVDILFLGQLMWIRTGAFAMLTIRRISGVGFGFWPTKRDWKIGTIFYLAFLIIAIGVGWWIGFGKP